MVKYWRKGSKNDDYLYIIWVTEYNYGCDTDLLPAAKTTFTTGKGQGKMFRFAALGQAADSIPDGACIGVNAFLTLANPVAMIEAIADRYERTGHPRDLVIITPSGCGCWDEERGLDRLVGLGAVRRVISSHYGSLPGVRSAVSREKIEGYNLPLGVLSGTLRAAAGGLPGYLSPVGAGLFLDPALEGPGMNSRSEMELVTPVELEGERYLYYKVPKLDVAVIRGTSVDPRGNITFEREFMVADALAMAQAAKAAGGTVIVQVENVRPDFDRPRNVIIPANLVDLVCVVEPNAGADRTPWRTMSGDIHVPDTHMDYWMEKLSLSGKRGGGETDPAHQIIGRRAARELRPGQTVNIGIGIPEVVGKAAAQAGLLRDLTLTVESGGIGGLPAPGVSFGAMLGADFICDMAQQFDFYNGGGLDICFMGGLEVDRYGNVNAHRLEDRFIGIGGFANITYATKTVVFCVTFTAGGLRVAEEGGQVRLLQEGRHPKFVDRVRSISFPGENARRRGQRVLYVTERCVFALGKTGLELWEVFPGVRKQEDVLDLLPFRVEDRTEE